MDLNSLVSFIVVAAILVMSPGPNSFLIIKSMSTGGRKAGFANIAGFVGAFYIHGSLSIFGISILLVQTATAYTIFKAIGALYLFYIGFKALRSAFSRTAPKPAIELSTEVKSVPVYRSVLEGFFTNMLNPKVSLFYLAAFPQFISLETGASSAYLLVALHALVNIIWFSILIFALSKVKKVANNQKVKSWLNMITGGVFMGFSAKLAFSSAT